MPDEFLTVAEVASLLKRSQRTVRNMIDRGELRAVRLGPRRVRVRQSDLDALLAAKETTQDQEAGVELDRDDHGPIVEVLAAYLSRLLTYSKRSLLLLAVIPLTAAGTSGRPTGATSVTATSATLYAKGSCSTGRARCRYYFQHGPQGSRKVTTTNGTIPGVGTMVWGDSYSHQTNLNKYSVVGLGSGHDSKASALPGTTLDYENGSEVATTFWDGVSYTEARTNHWLLYCADGSQVYDGAYPYARLVNLGDSRFQNQFLTETLNWLATNREKGVFLDDVDQDVMRQSPHCKSNGAATGYPFYNKTGQVVVKNRARWQRDQVAFLKAVGSGLKAHGYYVMVNGPGGGPTNGYDNDGSLTKTWVSDYYRYVSAVALEYFQNVPWAPVRLRSTGTAWYQHWGGWESTEAYIQSLGLDFAGIDDEAASCTNLRTARYVRASVLMEWNRPTSTWISALGGDCDHWNVVTAYSPGSPTGGRFQLAPGVWQRNFTAGTVVINTNSHSVTVSVNGSRVKVRALDAAYL